MEDPSAAVHHGVTGVTPPALSMHEFVEACRHHEQGVRRLCLRYLRSPEAADDATQETFLRASVLLRTVRPDVLGAYLNTIARNVCLEELRREQRRARRDEALRGEVVPHADPEDIVVDRSFVDRVWRCLTARDRSLFVLRIAGYSYEEIAQRLRISVKAVDVGLMRARRRARRALDGLPALVAWWTRPWRRPRRAHARRWRSPAVRGSGGFVAGKLTLMVLLLPALSAAQVLLRAPGVFSQAVAYRSPDLAGAAAVAHQPSQLSGVEVSSLALSPGYSVDRTIYASGHRVDCSSDCPVLARSGDGGHSWQALPARGFSGGAVLLAPGHSTAPIVFATNPDGLQRSDDGGSTFRTVVRAAGAAAVAPGAPPGEALVAIASERIALYHAGSGAITAGPVLPAGTLATDVSFSADGRHLLVAAVELHGSAQEQAGVLRCGLSGPCRRILVDDRVAAFRLVALPSTAGTDGIAIAAPHRLYLASPDGTAARLVHAFDADELTFLAAARNGSAGVRLVAELRRDGGGSSRLADSVDGGRSFTPAGASEVPGGITAVAAAPDGHIVIAIAVGAADLGRGGGLRCSPDGGRTWRPRG